MPLEPRTLLEAMPATLRFAPFLLSLALLPGTSLAQACGEQAFGANKHAVEAKAAVGLPKGFARPVRGIVATSQGWFINEGRAKWWIADIDRHQIIEHTYRGAEYADEISAAGEVVRHPDGSATVTRTLVLDDRQLAEVVCRANRLWSYRTSYELEEERRQMLQAEQEAARARWEDNFKDIERCLQQSKAPPSARRQPPPPAPCTLPPPPVVDVEPISELAASHPLLSAGNDWYESISLLDGPLQKEVGGEGILQGEAADVVEWLRSQFERGK